MSIQALREQITDDTTQPINLPSWPRLSSASKLLRPGGLSVLGGAPGSGKSFMALSIGLQCAAQGARWRYLPLESDRNFHLRRLATRKPTGN